MFYVDVLCKISALGREIRKYVHNIANKTKKPRNFKQNRNCVAFWKTWRRVWDSNPRALSDNCISSAARYDHFDNSPNRCIRTVRFNGDTTLCIISHFTKKSKLFLKIVLVHKFHLNVLVKIISFVVFSLVLQKDLTFPEKSIIIKWNVFA